MAWPGPGARAGETSLPGPYPFRARIFLRSFLPERVVCPRRPGEHGGMTAAGGYARRPDGSVVVAVSLPHPACQETRLRVLVHASNRQRALTRLRNLGFRSVHLRGNAAPPTPDEVSVTLHHPEGLVWRAIDAAETDLWQPASALFRAVRH